MFVLSMGYGAEDLKWPTERFAKAFDEVLSQRFIEHDPNTDLILIRNHLKHNPLENPNQVTAALKVLEELPTSPLFALLSAAVERLGKPFLEPLREQLAKRYAKPVSVAVSVSEALSQDVFIKEQALATNTPEAPPTLFGAPLRKDPKCFTEATFRKQFIKPYQKLVHPHDTPPNLERTFAALDRMCERIQFGLHCRGQPSRFCRPLLAHALKSTAEKKAECRKTGERFDGVAWFLAVFESEANERWPDWKERCR